MRFGEIPVGDEFEFDGGVYMRTYDIRTQPIGGVVNAICLRDGRRSKRGEFASFPSFATVEASDDA